MNTTEGRPQVTIPGTWGGQHTVTLGHLDDAARFAFAHGQCHALARAVTDATGWPLAALIDDACYCETCAMFDGVCAHRVAHLIAVHPDGRHVDIAGAHRPGMVPECEGKDAVPVTDDMWAYLVASPSWRPPATDAARTFVAPLLASLT
jgi:hypothetical protein